MAVQITDYINFTSDISTDKLNDVEQRIRLLLREQYPTVNTSPSSVFGSLVLTPASRVIALFEQAVDCLLSDLELENALNEIVCNCDFVQNFLLGLGLSSLSDVNTTSMVRITLNASPDANGIVFDQGYPLLFNDTYIFNFIGGNTTDIKIYPSTKSVSYNGASNNYLASVATIGGSNGVYEPNSWFVDIPVYGPATSRISQGDLAAIDEDMPFYDNIISVEALEDIEPLTLPTNIGEMVKLCREIIPSANLTTKSNAVSFIFNKYPKAVGASAVTTVDSYARTIHGNPPTTPFLDLQVKGVTTYLQSTEVFPMETTAAGKATLSNIKLQHIPLVIRSVSAIDLSGILYTLDKDFDSITITSSTAASGVDRYTKDLTYSITYNQSAGEGLTALQNYGYIAITYSYDPLAEAVSKYVDSPACSPVIETTVRPFISGYVKNLTVNYRKDSGKFFDRQQAIADIYDFVNNLTYPTIYDEGYIGDIMITNGASGISSITGTVVWMPTMNSSQSIEKDSLKPLATGSIEAINENYILDRENIILNETVI